MKMTAMQSFDPDFAEPSEWARMYRSVGMQVVPAMSHRENKTQWKRPALPKWRALEHELAPDLTFERWYGENGEHARRNNMGLIAGACSGGIFVVDLDLHKDVRAQAWWDDMFHMKQSAGELETVEQETGGGGVQLFFRAPAGWTPPTCKTSIGVDIRGQGGFAMMPPSMHQSGQPYRWKPGKEPWEIEFAEAPRWLCDQIMQLSVQHGGGSGVNPVTGEREKTASPAQAVDPFGSIVDGREDYMAKMVWGAVVDLKRECPGDLGPLSEKFLLETFATYERKVKTRLNAPGVSNADLLEREDRGISMFRSKWENALEQWDGKVAQHAAVEKPGRPFDDRAGPEPETKTYFFDPETGEIKAEIKRPDGVFAFLDLDGIDALPDPTYIIEDVMVEMGFGLTYGPPGCGKSFIELGKALSIASGLPEWFGKKILKHGPVVYISSEGVGDMKYRIHAWKKENGISHNNVPFFLIHETMNFMAAGDVTRLINTVGHISTISGAPVAVFVDTVSRVLPGADENLQKDMTLFIGACDAVRQTFKTTVVGVHHTSRQGNLRGSTVFDGAADFLYAIEREEGETVGEIHAKKIKSAEDGWRMPFELKKVVLNDMTGKGSLYAKLSREQKQASAVWPDKAKCQQILNVIRTAWFNGKPLSSYSQTRKQGRYAPAIISQQFDLPEKVAEMMVDTWLSNQVLSYEVADKSTKMQGLKVIGSID